MSRRRVRARASEWSLVWDCKILPNCHQYIPSATTSTRTSMQLLLFDQSSPVAWKARRENFSLCSPRVEAAGNNFAHHLLGARKILGPDGSCGILLRLSCWNLMVFECLTEPFEATDPRRKTRDYSSMLYNLPT